MFYPPVFDRKYPCLLQVEKLQKAIHDIEAKFGSILNSADNDQPSYPRAQRDRRQPDRHSDKDSGGIPGLDSSYAGDSKQRDGRAPKGKKHLDDRGNARPSRQQDREKSRDRDTRERRDGGKTDPRKREPSRDEGKERERRSERCTREDDERVERAQALAREELEQKVAAASGPAAMQSSLFMGVSYSWVFCFCFVVVVQEAVCVSVCKNFPCSSSISLFVFGLVYF